MTEFKGLDETAVRAVVAKLQGGMPARVAAINAAYNDGITISAPHNEQYFIGRMKQLPAWPAVFVMAGPTTFREQGAHSMLTNIEIHVWVCERDQTGPKIAARLMRQARAIIEVIYDDAPQEKTYVAGSNSVEAAYRIFPTRSVPGAVFQPSGEDAWVGSYMIVFKAEQEEI